MHRAVIAGCGVLAQFGGVMLAFAFLATFGFTGVLTLFLAAPLLTACAGDSQAAVAAPAGPPVFPVPPEINDGVRRRGPVRGADAAAIPVDVDAAAIASIVPQIYLRASCRRSIRYRTGSR